MSFLRRLFFYAFTLIYVVCCPLTVLYALGYLVEPGTERGLVKTGLISISTAPPGASVHLGKSRYTKQTPTVLRDLLPGRYPLRVTLKEHQSWVRTVSVEAEKATVLERILLLPDTWRPQPVLAGPFQELIPLPGSHAMLLVRGPVLSDVVLYRYRRGTTRPAVSLNHPAAGWALRAHRVDQHGVSLLCQIEADQGRRMVWLEPKLMKMVVHDVSELISHDLSTLIWDATDEHQLFVLQGGVLDRVDPTARMRVIRVAEHVRGFGVRNRRVFVLTEDQQLQRMSEDGEHVEALTNEAQLQQILASEPGDFRVTALSDDVVLLLSPRGGVFANRPPYRLVREGILGIHVDVEQERALIWHRQKVGVIDYGDATDTELAIRWLYEQGKAITQASWVYEDSHVLIHDQERMVLLDDTTEDRPLAQLPDVASHSDALYAEGSGILYALDPTGDLSALEVIPRRELGLFAFPEHPELEPTPARSP